MNSLILKSFSETKSYIDDVQIHADNNRNSLGFLPAISYTEQAKKERLYVVINADSKQYLGHLLYGGRYPSIKIFQIHICSKARKHSLGTLLLTELIKYGESKNFITITANVAADLKANLFWEKNGFNLVRQKAGGKSKNRTINIRAKTLNTPSILNFTGNHSSTRRSHDSIAYNEKPILSRPSYAIDLNVMFDFLKKRLHHEEAGRIFQAGWCADIKLCVTAEFKNELERNRLNSTIDPILSFADNLPTLPKVAPGLLDPLIEELGTIVFPQRKSQNKITNQDKSDLTHLASAIHHKIFGFITREEAILKRSDILSQTFGLEILSPVDLLNDESDLNDIDYLDVLIDETKIRIDNFSEQNREALERLLVQNGYHQSDISEILHPGPSTFKRERKIITENSEIIGLASWEHFNRLKNETNLFIFCDESNSYSKRVVDHILEYVGRVNDPQILGKFNLTIGKDQTYTKQAALLRGYCPQYDKNQRILPDKLSKIVYRGILSENNWGAFRTQFEKLTNYSLPINLPTYNEFHHTGIHLTNNTTKHDEYIKLFDFETLISPGIVLCPKREAIILPIRVNYAEDLLGNFSRQWKLFPSTEALLHVEKAYFRKPRNKDLFHRGVPIFFYVSGKNKGYKKIIGVGRVTYSDYLSIEEIEINLSRQGVLPKPKLLELKNKNNEVHAITFDNFNLLQIPVAYDFLKKEKIISAANLITAEKISSTSSLKIAQIAFKDIS